jgi:hypothetical protein
MNKPALYTPEPGSLAARVLEIFAKAPDEYFTSGDLGNKLNVPSNSMRAYLKVAVEYGLLNNSRKLGDDTPYWRVGPRFGDWLALQRGESAPPVVRQAAAKTKRGGVRTPLPPITAESLVFEEGVAKPPRGAFARRGDSKYAPIFARLEAGKSVALPVAYMGTLLSAAKKRQKAGNGTYTVSRISETQCRIWRDA